MIIETQEAISVDDDEDLAPLVMGGVWSEFIMSIPESQARILTEGFNLILLSNVSRGGMEELMDPEAAGGFTNSTLPNILTNLLVDDTIHTAEKKNLVFGHITGNIIELLVKMGFIVDEDLATEEHLSALCKLASLFYDLNEYQDLIGLTDILDSQDIPPKDRYLMVMQRYLGENFDVGIYEDMILDVSEVTIKALRDALLQEDASEGVPDNIVVRLVANKALLEGTLAFVHIRSNGQLGGSIESFLTFFSSDLAGLRILAVGSDETKTQYRYGLEILAFHMCSELNNHVMRDTVMRYFSEHITDYQALIKLETLVQKLVLTHE